MILRFYSLTLAFLAVATGSLSAEWSTPTGKWETLTGCHLIENPANDGDSFHVRVGAKEFLFRLYAVDTPETSLTYRDRVRDQAKRFGITLDQTVKIGQDAERFTHRLLAGKSFTVQTRWQDARGASTIPRYFAVVTVDGKDLAELLTANGLTRVYGWTPDRLPGFSLARLENFENAARRAHLGGFAYDAPASPAISGSRVTTAAPVYRDGALVSAADRGSRLAPTVSSFTSPASPAVDPATGKVDVNTATLEQLVEVHGIGPAFAKAIIAGRPYENLEAIRRVRGIGPKTYARLAPYLMAAGL